MEGPTSLYAQKRGISDLTGLEYAISLTELHHYNSGISDISRLANLTNLSMLELGGNQIGDISPLVQNEGLSEGDYVDLRWNPLSSDSINIYRPGLEAR